MSSRTLIASPPPSSGGAGPPRKDDNLQTVVIKLLGRNSLSWKQEEDAIRDSFSGVSFMISFYNRPFRSSNPSQGKE